MKRIVGIDLSLAATGFAVIDSEGLAYCVFPTKLTGLDRMRLIRNEAANWARNADLVVMEGPSYGSAAGQRGHHERAGLWWMVYDRLTDVGTPIAVAPPKNLKQYATGKGNASKDAVLVAAAKRFHEWNGGNNEADAAWLAAMGADWLGEPIEPMPASHRATLDGVAWPETVGAQQ